MPASAAASDWWCSISLYAICTSVRAVAVAKMHSVSSRLQRMSRPRSTKPSWRGWTATVQRERVIEDLSIAQGDVTLEPSSEVCAEVRHAQQRLCSERDPVGLSGDNRGNIDPVHALGHRL